MSTKFKVGDKVKYIGKKDIFPFSKDKNKIYTIKIIEDFYTFPNSVKGLVLEELPDGFKYNENYFIPYIKKEKSTCITVKRRSNDWIAYLNNDTKIWDCGKTYSKAIALLILRCQKETGIRVNFEE